MKTKLFATYNIKGNRSLQLILFILFSTFITSCKKLVTIDPPISSIRTDQVFNADIQAQAAMAGVYTLMINGSSLANNSAEGGFARGLTTIAAGQSADELTFSAPTPYSTNKLTSNLSYYGIGLWSSAYKTIYGANAILEGIAASKSPDLHDNVRTELIAESKFLRAFSYLYLVSLFGDVPKVLTIDFNKTALLPRTPQKEIYDLIIQDLKDAQAVLPSDYSNAPNGQRIIPNKWAATALLARVYLYEGDYANAAAQASAVISNSQYNLVSDPNGVFLKNSKEAIWQLQQDVNITSLGNATVEGSEFIPNTNRHTGIAYDFLPDQFMNSFEPGDKRRQSWVDTTNSTIYGGPRDIFYYPVKYKTGSDNYVTGGAATEYYMVLRLAEQYLIRAEAEYRGVNGGAGAAIADLNVIRKRAGLADLPSSMSSDELLKAVAHERQIELFCEWGHRWFDLRRLGLAHDVLSNTSYKQPWAGDFQFLYPVPITEINIDHFLTQNPGYH
ncbi:MAG: SusD family protein [Mucilaginibacter sp.]|nr:SusD family protein [Mucilaginibacter sp.]